MREFADFLFGIAATQPAEYRRLLRRRARVHRRVASLAAEVHRTA